MRRGKEIIGLPVIDLSKGRKIAEVRDLVCEPAGRRVVALIINKGSLLRPARAIPWQLIYSVGQDAVTIKDDGVIVPLKELSAAKSYNRYAGKQVMTTSGQYLGHVDDLSIDTVSGEIVGCVLSDGYVGDLISGRAIIPVVEGMLLSEENMIVPDEPIDLSYGGEVQGDTTKMPNV